MNVEQTDEALACLNFLMPKPNPELFEIGNRLIDTREALGFTGWGQQAVFAEEAGLSRNRYNQWEKAKVRPPEKGLLKLWERFGIPPEWIWYAETTRLPFELAIKLKLAAPRPPSGSTKRKNKAA